MKKIIINILILTLLLVQNTAFAQEQSNDDFYTNAMQEKVKKNWVLPKNLYGQSSIISVIINKNGEIVDTTILTSSGDSTFDKSALNAIKKSAPFESSSGSDNTTIQLLFNPNYIKANLVNQNKEILCDNSAPASQELSVNNPNNYTYKCEIEMSYKKSSPSPAPQKVYTASAAADYSTYKSQINKIISYSIPKKTYMKEKYLVLKITLAKDGRIKNIDKQASSGDKNFDNSIINSIKKDSFPSIPDSVGTDEFTFAYTIDTNIKNEQRTNIYSNAPASLSTKLAFATSIINLTAVITNLVNTIKVINYLH